MMFFDGAFDYVGLFSLLAVALTAVMVWYFTRRAKKQAKQAILENQVKRTKARPVLPKFELQSIVSKGDESAKVVSRWFDNSKGQWTYQLNLPIQGWQTWDENELV